jgi:hypothetical protein
MKVIRIRKLTCPNQPPSTNRRFCVSLPPTTFPLHFLAAVRRLGGAAPGVGATRACLPAYLASVHSGCFLPFPCINVLPTRLTLFSCPPFLSDSYHLHLNLCVLSCLYCLLIANYITVPPTQLGACFARCADRELDSVFRSCFERRFRSSGIFQNVHF